MYKFKVVLQNKHSHATTSESSNNMAQLIKAINQAHNVNYSIVRTCDNKTMIRGSK